MLDQMREASVEKDLKRLLSNVTMQLDSIKRGYQTFGEAQTELVKQYPGMVMAELNKYENLILTYFSVQRTNNVIEEEDEVVDNMSQMTEEISGTTNRESVVPATQTISSLKQSMTGKLLTLHIQSSISRREITTSIVIVPIILFNVDTYS